MEMTQKEIFTNDIEKHEIGPKKTFLQVGATIEFEVKRNFKNIIISLVVTIAFYALGLIINLIQEGRDVEVYDNAADYLQGSYLSFTLSFFIMIIAIMFGANIIAYDYDKQTGNLLFPKITKGRLFTGRFIARYFMAVLSVIVYYALVIITTYIKFGEYPTNVWFSLGWAIFYMLAVFSLVVFFSSFMKKSSTVIVMSILMILIVFQMTTTILTVAGVDIEPLFILTYYSNIISQVIHGIPSERFIERPLMGPAPHGAPEGPTGFTWITPSEAGAAVGLLVYSLVLIVAAYLLFRRRQQK